MSNSQQVFFFFLFKLRGRHHFEGRGDSTLCRGLLSRQHNLRAFVLRRTPSLKSPTEARRPSLASMFNPRHFSGNVNACRVKLIQISAGRHLPEKQISADDIYPKNGELRLSRDYVSPPTLT